MTATPLPHPSQLPVPYPDPAAARLDEQAKPSLAGVEIAKHFKLPKLRLEIRDLEAPGATIFLQSVIASQALTEAVAQSFRHLYTGARGKSSGNLPGTRSITLVLKSMGGVAYTTGIDLDPDHKEIHFSLEYIQNISAERGRQRSEIMGVLVHEVVHCYQWNGKDSCPGGLIEGIADWVRLKADLAPPHWKKVTNCKWDAGYERTGYFLEYLEQRYGDGTISKLNDKLRTDVYQEKRFWTELLGRPVEQLWDDYCKAVEEEGEPPTKASEQKVI